MKQFAIFAVLLAFSAVAVSDDDTDMLNRVEFQVQADRDIDNDVTQATLVVERDDSNPSRLADDVNQTMGWALQQTKAEKQVRAQTGGYRTMPVYEDQRITRWRAEQELTLESREAGAINRLIGRLQEKLDVRGMTFTVSDNRRHDAEVQLTGAALDEFRARADAIAKRLGAQGYDIVQLQIQNNAAQPPPVFMSRTMAVPADSAVSSEPGTSHIVIGVRAVIRLRF